MVYNYFFRDFKSLEEFIKENIPTSKDVLLQIYTGYINKDFIKILIEFINKYKNIKVIGTTTAGEIIDNTISNSKIVMNFTIFENTKVRIYNSNNNDSFRLGKAIAKHIKLSTKAVITFCNGITTDGALFVKGFFSEDIDIPILGGLAGDNTNFIETFVFSNDGISDGAVAAYLDGDVNIKFIKTYGWEKIGKKFTITKCNHNEVFEIDDDNVFAILEKYLGKTYVENLLESTLHIPFCCVDYTNNVRMVTRVTSKSLIFNASVYNGSSFQIIIPKLEYFKKYAKKLIKTIVEESFLKGIYVYASVLKKFSLEREFIDELSFLSSYTNISGFFGYGEFAFRRSDIHGKKCFFENGGAVFVLISENDYNFVSKKEIKNTSLSSKNPNIFIKEVFGHYLDTLTKELIKANEILKDKLNEIIEENVKKNLIIQHQSKQAVLGEMISMIAHQWKQPLNVLSLYVENMILELKFGDKIDKKELLNSLEKIKQEIQRMNEIIHNFTNFAKPEHKPKEFNVIHSLKKALDLVSAQFNSRGIDVEINCTEDVVIDGFETLLEQVFINLLTNARDAFEENKIENPKLKIECYFDKKGRYIIKFIDNAGGIPPSVAEKIFNPYFTTKGPKGTGLGLYMSKKILNEKFDGDIFYKSREKGSEFKIVIGLKVIKK
jgi:signal transduction histidine kinase